MVFEEKDQNTYLVHVSSCRMPKMFSGVMITNIVYKDVTFSTWHCFLDTSYKILSKNHKYTASCGIMGIYKWQGSKGKCDNHNTCFHWDLHETERLSGKRNKVESQKTGSNQHPEAMPDHKKRVAGKLLKTAATHSFL